MPKLIVIMFGIILGVVGAQCTSSVADLARSAPTIMLTGQIHPTSLALAECTLKWYHRLHL